MDDTDRNDVGSESGSVAASGTTDPMSSIARETIQEVFKQAAADAKAEVKAEREAKREAAKAEREAKAKAKAEEKAKTEAETKAKAEAKAASGDWRNKLLLCKNGSIKKNTANATTILTHDARWQGVLAYNEFVSAVVMQKRPAWDADDDDGASCDQLDQTNGYRLQNWFAREYYLDLTEGQCYAAALLVAKKNQFHPIRDRLLRLQWDGVKRVETWLIRHLGAPDTPYVRMVSRMWLVAAVARAMKPGEKVDTMLILEGPQGIKKSTTLRTLFGAEWFTDASIDWTNKDRFEVLRGRWGVEMAELDGINKAEVSRVKAFLSTQEDRYRRPYAKDAESVPRQCVFAGTVNPNALGTYLRDDENRRFWPVKCTKNADLKALAAERDQLWAEARLWYEQEDETFRRWWPDTDEEKQLCADEADLRRIGDAWQGLVDNFLDSSDDELTITDVMVGIRLDMGRMDNGASVRIANCLKNAGWENVGRKRRDGKRESFYKRPDDDMERAAEARRQRALKRASLRDPNDW